MTTTTMEGNRIIAEFMGHPTDFKGKYKTAPYHTSWDWLMPVVEKIGNIKIGNTYPKIEIGGDFTTEIICGEFYKFQHHNKSILSVYFAVLEFINWYNTFNDGESNGKEKSQINIS